MAPLPADVAVWPLRLVTAHRLLGQLDIREQRYDRAAAHLDQSLTLAGACAAPYEEALSLLELAELRAQVSAACRRAGDAEVTE